MQKKLAVFDIDGTLLNSRDQVLPSTLAAIKRLHELGVHTAIATGRNYKMARWVIEAADIHDYVVCNGSAIYVQDKLATQRYLDKDEARMVNEFTRKMGTNFLAESADELYADVAPDPELASVLSGCHTQVLHEPGYAFKQPIVQGLALLTPEQEAQAPHFKSLHFKRFGDRGVDVIPRDGNKAKSVLKLADRLGVNNANIVAFGDNQNDKEMLTAVGTGIAMGHADDNVKAAANWVTGDMDSDGIATGLKHVGWL